MFIIPCLSSATEDAAKIIRDTPGVALRFLRVVRNYLLIKSNTIIVKYWDALGSYK